MEWDWDNNTRTFLIVINYKCSNRGKRIWLNDTNQFKIDLKSQCQSDEEWSTFNFNYSCEWFYCNRPKTPPPGSNLKLKWDPHNWPA
ncbi:hypothetical protein TCAL_12024, partial [Tigriopus californicus]|eukprot:TCALIF_12024-PA protein Name:"Protein of unknown function" AED:0.07 eAED:0.07 QI:44/1/0.66/1/0/0.33/3/0/86